VRDIKVRCKALASCLLLLSQNIFAVEVKNIYETEVIALSQSEPDRNAAITEALKIVLTRVMAGDNILADPTVQSALSNAQHYVKQYQYSLATTQSAISRSSRVMRVLFDESLLIELMKSSKLGVWSEIRPELLVWLVVEKTNDRQLFNAGQMPDIEQALHDAAEHKALPVLLPLMDLEDRQNISVNDVLSAYSENLLAASRRYDVPAVLAGRIIKKDNCWLGEWTFYFDDKINQWSGNCHPLSSTLLAGIQGTYTILSKYYAVTVGMINTGAVTLKIEGIKGSTDRNRVTGYLQSLPMVKSVIWLRMLSGADLFEIRFAGDRRNFEEMLGLGRVLEPITKSNPGSDMLDYQLTSKMH
jgi:uncharacterized protein